MSNGEIRVSITEIPKIREALEKADKEIERLNNIIKEVRELANTLDDNEDYIGQFIRQDILDILDEVDKEKI